MKTNRFPSSNFLTVVWLVLAPHAMAETNERTVEPVPEATDNRPVIPIPSPSPARLTASIKPIDKSVTTGGTIEFFMVGNAATLIGRITGLDPNKRYQALIQVPLAPIANPSGQTETVVEADLGMLVADANGIANLNTSIADKNLEPPPRGIQGCTIVIKRAPPLDSREERSPVGSGAIVTAGPVVPAPAAPLPFPPGSPGPN